MQTKELTREEKERIRKVRCAMDTTDIFSLCYCVMAWLEDLKVNLEKENLFQQEIKRGVNRACTTTGQIVSEIYENMKGYNPQFVEKYTEMSEELIGKLDTHIYLQGVERDMNMIATACYIMFKKMINIEHQNFYFDKMKCVKKMEKIPSYLSLISYDKRSLIQIFEQQLATMYSNHGK